MFSLFSHFRIQILRLTKGKHDVQIYFQAYLLFSLKIKIKIIINKWSYIFYDFRKLILKNKIKEWAIFTKQVDHFNFLFNSKWFQNPTKDTGINNPFITSLKLEEIFFKIK